MVVSVQNSTVHCTLVGDGMVGKTCLVKAFVDHIFPKNYVSTVLDKYNSSTFVDGCKYNIDVTDVAGEHDLESMSAVQHKDNVYVICYSVVDRESFESVKTYWAQEIKYLTRKPHIVLVATQTDLRKGDHDNVTKLEGQSLAKEIGTNDFVECSAFTKEGIMNVFKTVVTSALRYKKKHNIVKRVFNR